jgi:flagellar assembly protein FliH
LREEVRRSSLFDKIIIKQSDAVLYSMPSLEEEHISQSRDDILQKNGDIQRQEYEEGFASGEKAGFTEGEQKASVLIDRLEKIIEEMTMFKENLVKDAEKQVVDLAVAIARINTRPEIIITMVKEALKKLQKVGTITIKINPALYDLFMKKKPELIDIHQDIIFDVNSNIPLTGPLVISQTEEVVTDIDSLMSNIIEEMRIDRGQSSEDASQTIENRRQRTD